MEHQSFDGTAADSRRFVLYGTIAAAITLLVLLCSLLLASIPTSAAPSIPYKMNFQGRLTNSAGNIMADGLYNVQFRIYDTSSAGTLLWTETRETTARIQVTNGLFSTQLGDVTSLPPAIFNSATPRYFEITLATPATATCSTAACATWESPMTPRQPMASSAYAFNADQIDGIDGSSLARNDAANIFTAANTFSGSVEITGANPFTVGTGTANFGGAMNVSGTVSAGALVGPSLDTATATQLNIGSVNATSINLNQSATLAAGKSLTVTGGITSTRPASPTEGMVYYDTTIKSLLVYANGKWQADRSTSTVIVGTTAVGGISGATASKVADGADFVNTSDTSAQTVINAAIATLPATGGSVYLMEGTYIVDGSINLPNNVTLTGAGNGTVIKLKNAHNVNINMITNSDATTGTRVTIQDLRIDGNKANQTAGFQHGIYLNAMGSGAALSSREGARISNVIITDLRRAAIYLLGSSNNDISNVKIRSVFNYGIYLTGSSNNTITNNTIYNADLGGIKLDSLSSNNTVSGNISVGSTVGSGIALSNSSNNTVSGNTSRENSYEGIYVGNSSNGNTITANTTSDNDSRGIDLYLSSNNTISGNTIARNGYLGIWLDSSDNNTVSSNTISDSSGTTINDAIYLSSSDGNSITSNIITDTSCTTNCYAINIISSTSDLNYLADNRFSSTSGTASIRDLGTGTVYANQSRAVNGGQLTNRTANDASAFSIQNAAGVGVLNVDTTLGATTLRGTTAGSDEAVIGAELVTSQDFSNATFWTCSGWTTTTTSATHTTGNTTACSATASNFTVVAGATYQITFDLSGNTTATNSVRPSIGGVSAPTFGTVSTTTETVVVTGATTGALTFTPTTNYNGTISAISVKQVTKITSSLTVQDSTGVARLEVRTGGVENTFVGLASGQANTTGNFNTALGANALQSDTSGGLNTAIGNDAMKNNTTGGSNTAVGGQALRNNVSGNFNTAIGRDALFNNTTGFRNTASGTSSLYFNTTGIDNTASGNSSLYSNTTGSGNTASGAFSLFKNPDGSANTATGWSSLYNLKTLTGTVSAAASGGAGVTTFTSSSTTGLVTGSTVIISGTTNYNGSWIVTVINATSFSISTAFVSTQTGSWTTAIASSNAAFGYSAGEGSASGYSAVGNSLFGFRTGFALQTGADYNTFMGYSAGTAVTTGKNNTVLGYNAGTTLTSGSNNIIIGQGVNATSATGSNQLNIGGAIQGDLSSGNISIGAVPAAFRLNVTDAQASTYVTRIQNTSTSTDADGLLIDLGVADASRTASNYFVGFASAGTVAGKIQGGASAVAYTTTGADYAEYFRADPADLPVAGEIVAQSTTDGKAVVKATAGSGLLAGVVSSNPGFVGNGPLCNVDDKDCDANYAKYNSLVALSGQVPVKVNTTNGSIAIGDPITASSVAGEGAKLDGTGYIVGYAMESLASGNGTIQVLIRPDYRVQSQQDMLQATDMTLSGTTTVSGALNVSGATTLTSLVVTGSAEIRGELKVVGNLRVANIIVGGRIVTQGATPTIIVGGASGTGVTQPSASVDGNSSAGTISLTSGQIIDASGVIAEITFAGAFAGDFKISLTPVNEPAVKIQVYVEKVEGGFRIVTTDKLTAETQYKFDYIAIGTDTVQD